MAQKLAITLNENNDENVNCSITTNQPSAGTVLDLTGMTVEAYLKSSKSTLDTDASVWKGSTATSGVSINSAAAGTIIVSIPATAIDTSKGWWRVDVISASGKRKTALYGAVTVNDL